MSKTELKIGYTFKTDAYTEATSYDFISVESEEVHDVSRAISQWVGSFVAGNGAELKIRYVAKTGYAFVDDSTSKWIAENLEGWTVAL